MTVTFQDVMQRMGDGVDIQIADQTLELGGEEFVWSHNVAGNSWSWRTADYMDPPTAMKLRLNRLFIEQNAAQVATTLEPVPKFVFVDVLKKMGASNEQIEMAGLGDLLALQNSEYRLNSRFKKLPPPGHTPFNNPVLRDWLLTWPTTELSLGGSVAILGEGPFERDELTSFLVAKGFDCQAASDRTDLVILGRSGWEEAEVDDVIDDHVGRCLRIYSQEMFVAYLAKHDDPFLGGEDVLAAFRAGHPGLEFVSQGWPGWVQTYVAPSRRSPSTRSTFDFEVEESPLHVMGYSVGQQGAEESTRHEILRRAFCEQIPIVGPPGYMQQWGEPSSAQRLKKIADNLSTSCRNARSRANPPQAAISDWESDLEWLRETLYHGHMIFDWPSTHVW